MIKSFFHSLRAPASVHLNPTLVIRLLVVLSVALALLAGYYHASWENQLKKYQRLEDMFVRVRSQLGREEMQRLIDLSREQEKNK